MTFFFGNAILHFVWQNGSFEIVELRLNKGADINAKTIISQIYFKYSDILFLALINSLSNIME
jgi:hypothetical protein